MVVVRAKKRCAQVQWQCTVCTVWFESHCSTQWGHYRKRKLLLLFILLRSHISLRWPFFNPTIEIVTVPFWGWCMLGVLFWLALTRLGHKSYMSGSFESVWWNACVHRLDYCLHFHSKEFLGNGVRAHTNSMGKIPSTGGSEEGWTCITQDSKPNTLLTELFQPKEEKKTSIFFTIGKQKHIYDTLSQKS